jgi:hypothetical protein
MKTFRPSVMALLCSLLTLQAQEPAPEEPGELTGLRTAWIQADERDARPLKENYLVALQRLQEKLTGQGALDAAVAARDEIELLTKVVAPGESGEKPENAPEELVSLRAIFGRELRSIKAGTGRSMPKRLRA